MGARDKGEGGGKGGRSNRVISSSNSSSPCSSGDVIISDEQVVVRIVPRPVEQTLLYVSPQVRVHYFCCCLVAAAAAAATTTYYNDNDDTTTTTTSTHPTLVEVCVSRHSSDMQQTLFSHFLYPSTPLEIHCYSNLYAHAGGVRHNDWDFCFRCTGHLSGTNRRHPRTAHDQCLFGAGYLRRTQGAICSSSRGGGGGDSSNRQVVAVVVVVEVEVVAEVVLAVW